MTSFIHLPERLVTLGDEMGRRYFRWPPGPASSVPPRFLPKPPANRPPRRKPRQPVAPVERPVMA